MTGGFGMQLKVGEQNPDLRDAGRVFLAIRMDQREPAGIQVQNAHGGLLAGQTVTGSQPGFNRRDLGLKCTIHRRPEIQFITSETTRGLGSGGRATHEESRPQARQNPASHPKPTQNRKLVHRVLFADSGRVCKPSTRTDSPSAEPTAKLATLSSQKVIVVGGGAAGIFAAITCAEAAPEAEVLVLEKSPQCLTKVRISGGGRCNVTHACFEARAFASRYPRGGQELIGPLQKFSARDTVNWFAARGVRLKTERDGRMFPVTDSSQTIIDCLLAAASAAGVGLRTDCGVVAVQKLDPGFQLHLASGEKLFAHRVLLATGGCRAASLGQLAVALGHTLEDPVPSLFTFQIEAAWLRPLAGVSLELAEVSVPGTKLLERGPTLVTHWGLSGPAILRLSAWGARQLHGMNYQFPLGVNWLPDQTGDGILREFQIRRESAGAKLVVNVSVPPLTMRLWKALVLASGIPEGTRWAALTRDQAQRLRQFLTHTELSVSGKSLNKDEFVTCGGVCRREVNFQTMASRLCPGLYFAGELLDVDGLTGGFNFQAAWTTGWLAGRAMAGA